VRVLLIGSGGREHALALALSRDPAVTELIATPGNPGIASVARLVDGDPVEVALAEGVDLVVVGPEAPLVSGVADPLRAKGIAVFGPSKAAARLEGSKDFAKQVMRHAGVPTARSFTCTTAPEVRAALDAFGAPYVVKDDGLAAGKGVVVTSDREQALAHAARCERVVIEEYLEGPEVSLFVVCDGQTALPLQPAQDFKRVGDNDTGPNTGGMGAYTPLPWAPPDLTETVMARVVHPTLARMVEQGTPFQGLLFVGLAITKQGPKVIEFNVRFGDPEAQVLLEMLESPLGRLLEGAATGRLAEHRPLRWKSGAAVAVVIASHGYPQAPRTGDPIEGAEGLIHAGTKVDGEGVLRSAGGRVLCAVGVGDTLSLAREAAYEKARRVRLEGAHYRTDIALSASQ
jgi:phosphoribosylamine---glycine ligase